MANGNWSLHADPVTGLTSAQLTALAAAGGLTPYATYVASDTGWRAWARDAYTLVRTEATIGWRANSTAASPIASVSGAASPTKWATPTDLKIPAGALYAGSKVCGKLTCSRIGVASASPYTVSVWLGTTNGTGDLLVATANLTNAGSPMHCVFEVEIEIPADGKCYAANRRYVQNVGLNFTNGPEQISGSIAIASDMYLSLGFTCAAPNAGDTLNLYDYDFYAL